MDDLANLRFAADLAVTPISIEFNVVGSGHEFWIAVEEGEIIGLTVLGRTSPKEATILYLNVSKTHKSMGVGSALISAVIADYPEREFIVIPSDGTQDFYRRLGFVETEKWEMRKRPINRDQGQILS